MKDIEKKYDFEGLIARYLAGDCSDDEGEILERWVRESKENQKLFADFKKTWLLSSLRKPARLDVERQWQSIENQISPKVSLRRKNIKARRQFPYRWSIAAAIALLFGLVFYFSKFKNETDYVIVTAQNEIENVILPDGTNIDLNAGAVIRYPDKFGLIRKVELSGTAFFKVTRDEKHPFVIQAHEAQIQVLGTSFLVKSSNQKTEVVVKSGKVSLANTGAGKVILTKGEHGILQDNRLLETQNQDRNFMAWKTKEIIFDDDSLTYVIEKINEVYHSHIHLKNRSTAGCSLSAHFENETLEDVLTVVSTTLNLKINRKNGIIELEGESCTP
jgi:ferric-dicitrate binding protein FerR (iron transport regulator)